MHIPISSFSSSVLTVNNPSGSDFFLSSNSCLTECSTILKVSLRRCSAKIGLRVIIYNI